MKHKINIYLVSITALMVGGCSTTAVIKPYVPNSEFSSNIPKGLVFSLPKTLMQMEITYSLYEKKTWPADAQGNAIKKDDKNIPTAPKSSSKIVSVDVPVKTTTKNIPDHNLRFSFDPATLNGFFKDTEVNVELTADGMLKTTNAIIKDKTKEIVANSVGTIVNAVKIAAVAGTDVVELVKIKDVTVIRLIDISELTFTKQNDGKYLASYSDADMASELFENISTPEVKVSFISSMDVSPFTKIKASDESKSAVELDGIPYRVGGQLKVVISINDLESFSLYTNFAQASGLSVLPLKSKIFTDTTQGITFSDDGSYLSKTTSKTTSQGEALSLTLKDNSNAVFSALKELDQVTLDKVKKEKEILDAQNALIGSNNTSDLQLKLDKLKKEKELIDAELALKEAKKKLAESK
ncbi:hypothetical protein ACK32U_15100 [Aeromonas dhakensis]|uniref:hypothetical protein n=1 Tax=Aeromonas dhakensis TaxID=196024 RepID=UPI003988A35F